MTDLAELQVVQMLCDGVDPRTGELLTTPRNLRVDEARIRYLKALQALQKGAAAITAAQLASNGHFGQRWRAEDDAELRQRWTNEPTVGPEDLAHRYGRTSGAILARLVHLGIYPDRETAQAAAEARKLGVVGTEAPGAAYVTQLRAAREALDLRTSLEVAEVQHLLQTLEDAEAPAGWQQFVGPDTGLLSLDSSTPMLCIAVNALASALEDRDDAGTAEAALALAERFEKISSMLMPYGMAKEAERQAHQQQDRARILGAMGGVRARPAQPVADPFRL